MRDLRPVVAVAILSVLGAACNRFGKPQMPDTPPTAQQLAELWMEPEDISARDLFHGPGGEELQPRPGASFRLVARDTTGFSGGYDVVDASGMKWSAKFGPEAQSETVVSRIVWAIGFHQPPTYYVTDWKLEGASDPAHPSRFRPDLPGRRRTGEWSWRRNPFVGSQPYKGKLVLMRIVNNWDLLDRNNTLYELDTAVEGARRWYVTQDLGAGLGKTITLGRHSGTRNDLEDFLAQGFIDGVDADGEVSFDEKGKWHRGLFDEIRVADVHWTCSRLAKITDRQWADAFRAGGYEEATAARYIAKIKEKIAAGLALRAPA
jgi:hypothetical protein